MLSSKEALERIKKSHFTAMACLEIEDKETEQAINIVEKDLDRLEKLERIFEILRKHMYACRGFMELRITTPKNYKEALKNSWTRYYNGTDVTDKDYDELYDLWLEVLKNER